MELLERGGVGIERGEQLGERDVRRGEYPLQAGLADGDQILRKPGSTLVDGQKIEFVSANVRSTSPNDSLPKLLSGTPEMTLPFSPLTRESGR